MPENQLTDSQLKNIYCSNKECRKILGQTDGMRIAPANERVFSKLLSHKKKRSNPLYCIHCHRITRWYKGKPKSGKTKKAPGITRRDKPQN